MIVFKSAINYYFVDNCCCFVQIIMLMLWFEVNGEVCSGNTTKGVLCYTSRRVTKHIFLQNTPESV